MYDPRVNGERLNFGISGLLYESTVLFFDRQTKSLWSQLSAEAVSGPHRGAVLEEQSFTDTTWGAWRRRHPATLVLSRETGHRRSYGSDPYSGRRGLMFPVSHRDRRLRESAVVFGVTVGNAAKAYPRDVLKETPRTFRDTIGGVPVILTNDPPGTQLQARTAAGVSVPVTRVKWFAWAAFHRNTAVFGPKQ